MSEIERIWRIEIQILSMQLIAWKSKEEGREQWKIRMWETLLKINQLAQEFQPSSLPSDLSHCNAPNVDGGWLENLMSGLREVFFGVPVVNTTRIEE